MNNIFDGFEFDGAWFGETTVNFAGKDVDIEIEIDGYDDVKIPENSKTALLSFLEDMDNIMPAVIESIFEYYHITRKELGYDMEYNPDYSDYKSCEEILQTLQLVQITVPDQDDYSEPAISLVFECDWDEEEGVGVCLVGNKVDEVGQQGIAL